MTSAFGVAPKERRDGGFVEMVQHACTLGSLPRFCFTGTRRLRYTFSPAFEQFLRFSHSSPLKIEAARLTTALAAVLMGILPLALGSFCGWTAGVRGTAIGEALLSSAASSTTVVVTVYGVVASGSALGMASGVALAIPWTLTIAREFLTGNGYTAVSAWLPVGLPYGHHSWHEPSIRSTALLVGVIAVFRLLSAARRQSCCRRTSVT